MEIRQTEEKSRRCMSASAVTKKRSDELDVLIRKLYESFAKEQITEKRFALLSAEYEKEQARYKRMKVREYATRKNQKVAEKKRREKEEAQRRHAAEGSDSP